MLVLGLAAPGWLAADLESVSLPKARIAFSVLRNVRREKNIVSVLDCVLLQFKISIQHIQTTISSNYSSIN